MRDFNNIKRIVVKIGTSTLTKEDGSINYEYIEEVVGDVMELKKKSREVILVSSGAIGLGRKELKLEKRPRDIFLRQACAAIGQTGLMREWQNAFGEQKVAQLLLTYDSFVNRKTYVNLNNSMRTLLEMGVVPIINENDPISINEIDASFGDNDKLSALVASKIEAGLLILVSDIDGLYTRNPKLNKKAELVKEVKEITPEIEKMCHKAGCVGTGGMYSKIEAGKICNKAGVYMVIASSKVKNVVLKAVNGEEIGTLFVPKGKISHKKRWIEFAPSKGKIVVDEGAVKAMKMGKNLLPAGVKDAVGSFEKDDVVEICFEGKCFGKAIVEYCSDELKKVMGKSGKRNVYVKGNVVML